MAISRWSAKRRVEIISVSSASLTSGMDEIILVCALVEMALTVIPKPASSFAAVLVNPMISPFAAAKLAWPNCRACPNRR